MFAAAAANNDVPFPPCRPNSPLKNYCCYAIYARSVRILSEHVCSKNQHWFRSSSCTPMLVFRQTLDLNWNPNTVNFCHVWFLRGSLQLCAKLCARIIAYFHYSYTLGSYLSGRFEFWSLIVWTITDLKRVEIECRFVAYFSVWLLDPLRVLLVFPRLSSVHSYSPSQCPAPAIWNSLSLTSVLAKLSQHSADTWNLIFPFSLCHCLATHLSASDSFTTMALYEPMYLLTYLLTYLLRLCASIAEQ